MSTHTNKASTEEANGQPPEAAAAASPPWITWGESPQEDGKQLGAFTDYLNATFRLPSNWAADPAAAFFERFTEVSGSVFGVMEDQARKLYNYAHSFRFERGAVLYAFGGEHQAGTALLSIPGDGCALLRSWDRLVPFLRDELEARVTRWDGAIDDFHGVHSVGDAVALYLAGAFNAGGRKPSCAQAGNWLTEDGSGRTFYVGKRKNGKMLRVYEKGKQLGFASSPWTRWEVELHNIDREIPWQVISDPALYIAGAYPALAWVSGSASRIPTLQRADAITYKRIIFHARVAYGRLIDTMMEREGRDPAAVVRLLQRPGVPQRLELYEALGIGAGVSDAN